MVDSAPSVNDGDPNPAPAVAITDLPVFGPLGLDDEPATLLGTRFLEGRRIGIDHAAARLYLFD